MKIVYIHGRAQEGKSSLEIKTVWDAGLIQGYRRAEVKTSFDPSLSHAPFYGNRLAEATEGKDDVIRRGPRDAAPDPLAAAIVGRMAERAQVEPEASLEPEVLERGPERWEWVQALARAIDQRLTWLTGEVIDTFTADVGAYINREFVRDEINAIVRLHIGGGPCLVVGHSLGSVVGYSLLVEMAEEAEVPLYVTLGSPLGLKEIQARLEEFHPLEFPRGVEAWFNAADERDVVALHSVLDDSTFLPGIDNYNGVENAGLNPHDITGYLGDPVVARRIAAEVKAA